MTEEVDLVKKESITKQLVDRLTLEAAKAVSSTPTMDAILAFQNSQAMRGALGFQNSLLQAIGSFQNSSAMRAMQSFQNSPAMRAIQAIHDLPTIKLERFLDQLRPVHEHLQRLGAASDPLAQFRNAAQAIECSQASPLAVFFASERSAEIPELLEATGDAKISVAVSGDFRVVTAAELELERQIVGHFEQGKSASTLTGEQKSRLHLVLRYILCVIVFVQMESSVRLELCLFQPKLAPNLTSRQVGKAVRNFMCEREFSPEHLHRLRSVKGNGVKLRAGPGMKEEVLPVILQDRALLEILSSDDRDWLYVSVLGEDGVDGWISRKYTHRSTQ